MGDEAANAEVVRRYIETVINSGRVDLIDAYVAADYRGHGFNRTRDDLAAFMAWQSRTAPDWHIDIQDVVAAGDRVVVRANASGHTRELQPGVPSAELQLRRIEWIAIYRVADALIAEAWVVSRDVDQFSP
jgi:predicted SnoaL-like aldol condensation-catalyzing enzyme